MEYVTLNTGVEMPLLGYGTYQTLPQITEQCVADALRVGYRSIDTAQCYGNEREVGLACKNSGIPRSENCYVYGFCYHRLWEYCCQFEPRSFMILRNSAASPEILGENKRP